MVPIDCEGKYTSFMKKEDVLKAMVYDRPESELIEDGELESTPQLIHRFPDGKESVLTYHAALGILNELCQLIPSDDFLPSPHPEYECHELGGNFVYKLTLPPMASLLPSQRVFMGDPMTTKKDAKRSAAFQACTLLRELGVLDEHLLPRREDRVTQACDANGRTIEASELPAQTEAIVPDAFGNLWTSSQIWLHKFSFQDNSPAGFSTMGLLSGRRLHIPDSVCLYNHFDKGESLTMNIEAAHEMKWDKGAAIANLKKLDTFTRLVIQASINRRGYEGELLFLVTPLLHGTCEIDWNLVEEPLISLSSIDDFSLYPCIIAPLRPLHVRIFDTFEPCHDLSGKSPPSLLPACSSLHRFSKIASHFRNLGHLYNTVYELNYRQDELKSLVYLEGSFEAKNNLAEFEPPSEPYKVLLPLKTCRGTHIPRSNWIMYSYLPSLTRILHDGSQMNALFSKFNLSGIDAPLAISALTPPGVGVPWNYQTLETIGDAFLKLATSVHVYLTCLKKGEGDMSLLRSRSTDNSYLRQKAIQANLPGYVLSQHFRVSMFRDTQTQDGQAYGIGSFMRQIPNKVSSDVVEALLGAGYLSGNVQLGLKVGMALDLCFGGTSPWNQRQLNISYGNQTDSLELSKYNLIEQKIEYSFKDKLLLIQALTHRSANSFLTNCYEREEWLGDAVIDMWIIERAYQHLPNATAEKLTLARNKVVNNGSLGFLAIRKLSLQDVIIHHSPNFITSWKEALEDIRPFQKIGDFFSNVDNLFVTFDPPKILNDVLESIVGAVFVDSGFNLQTIYQVLDLIFADVIPELPQLAVHDPLSRLLMFINKYQCCEMVRESSTQQEPKREGDDSEPRSTKVCHIRLHGEEIAVGRHATSSGVAEQRASLEALSVLEAAEIEANKSGMPNSLWSQCQCKSKAIAANRETKKKQEK